MTDGTIAIRAFREDDREQVEALYATVFGDPAQKAWRQRFVWQFETCPAARIRPSELWTAEAGGRVVGFLSSFPMRLSLGGREFATLCPCDLMVSSAARGSGLGQRLIETYVAATSTLVNALQYSDAAERIYDRIGYRVVPAEPLMLRLYDVRKLVAFKLSGAKASSPLWRVLGRTVLPLFGVAGNAVARAGNQIRRPRGDDSVVVERVTEAGPEFDALWTKLAHRFPAVFVRDRAFVQWRYIDDPLGRTTVLVARSRSGDVLGYAALMTADRRGVTFGYLLDVFTDPDAGPAIDALTTAALGALEEKRVAVVSCLGLHPAIRSRVGRFLYVRPRSRESPARLLWRGDPSMEATIYDAAGWHLSYADGDEAFGL